jgi:short chain dehydrogenase
MRHKREGRIINVSSVGGMMAMPTMAIYSASKFALEGATESLYYEVKPWNIKVTLVEPGFINSNSFENVRLTAASKRSVGDSDEAYHKHYEHMSTFIARIMRLAFATPDSIARRIVDIMHQRRPPLRSLVTLDAWIFSHLRRFLPRTVYHWLLYQSLPGVREWGTGPGKTLPAPAFADAPTYIPPSMAPNLSDAFFRFVPNPMPSGRYGQQAPSPAPGVVYATPQPQAAALPTDATHPLAPPLAAPSLALPAAAPSLAPPIAAPSMAPPLAAPSMAPPLMAPNMTPPLAAPSLPPMAAPSLARAAPAAAPSLARAGSPQPPPVKGPRQTAALLPAVALPSAPPPMPSGGYVAANPPPMPTGAYALGPPPMPSTAPKGATPPPMPNGANTPTPPPDAGTAAPRPAVVNEGGKRGTLQLAPRLSRNTG